MKLLYGVNAVGNGHISRARLMAKELYKAGIEVQYLFSGREQSQFFDMQIFGDPIFKKGLKFDIDNGKVNMFSTVVKNDFCQLISDIRSLNLKDYDFVITDYEPITAWASKYKKKESIGIGHQYSFNYNIPKSHFNLITSTVMKYYAPVDKGIGLHWNHFSQQILPPLIDTTMISNNTETFVLVYLPFENYDEIIKLFSRYWDVNFIVYGFQKEETINNIEFKKASVIEFRNDLQACDGVICNAGFELPSEALFLGKKLLIKPVKGQMEQHSNLKALVELKYGIGSDTFNNYDLEKFFSKKKGIEVRYPNVAAYIVEWLQTDRQKLPTTDIWNNIQID
jgi:uncharacterized protein (TIGR00661 family)